MASGWVGLPWEGRKSMSQLLKTMAEYYADLGLRVVPLHGVDAMLCTCRNPACKSPAKHPRTINGLKDGSNDREVVDRMWTRWPFASIGICTGTDSGVLVIDFDDLQQVPEILREWALSDHPPTWRSTTGRGGKHVFFRYDKDQAGLRSRSGVWPKVDVRADGGYVVAAPSPHVSGRCYAWDDGCSPADTGLALLPPEIEQVLRAGGGAPIEQPTFVAGVPYAPSAAALPAAGHLSIPPETVAKIRAALRFIDATPRQDWLYVGMALKSTSAGPQAYELWTEWSQTVPTKFDPDDQQKTWGGLRELLPNATEITLGKLFWLAKQRGAPDFAHLDVILEDVPPAIAAQVTGVPVAAAPGPEPEPVENLPGEGAEPVPTAVEPLSADFWDQLKARSPLIHEIVEWICSTAPKRQRLLAFGNTIAALGALLGRRVRSPRNTRTNLYVFGIAGTARGKEHSRQCTSALFVRAGLGHWIGGDKWKSDSGIRTELLKSPAHLAQIDEFGLVLAKMAQPFAPSHLAGIVETLLELSGRANGMDLGPSYADQKTRPREVILEPHLCVYATSVPGNLFEAMTSKSVAGGFLNRWICLFGEEQPDTQDLDLVGYTPPAHLLRALQLLEEGWRTEKAPASNDEKGVARYIPQLNLPGMCAEAHVLPKTPDATALGRQIGARIEGEAREREKAGDPLADMWLRVPETVEKLALLLAATAPVQFEQRDETRAKEVAKVTVAMWDGPHARRAGVDRDGFPVDAVAPSQITKADIELAHDLVVSAFGRFELEVAARVADSDYEGKVKKVKRCLVQAGTKGLSQRELTRKLQWLSSRERDDLLKTLSDSGEVVLSVSTTKGRPTTVFRFAGFGSGSVSVTPSVKTCHPSVKSSKTTEVVAAKVDS